MQRATLRLTKLPVVHTGLDLKTSIETRTIPPAIWHVVGKCNKDFPLSLSNCTYIVHGLHPMIVAKTPVSRDNRCHS